MIRKGLVFSTESGSFSCLIIIPGSWSNYSGFQIFFLLILHLKLSHGQTHSPLSFCVLHVLPSSNDGGFSFQGFVDLGTTAETKLKGSHQSLISTSTLILSLACIRNVYFTPLLKNDLLKGFFFCCPGLFFHIVLKFSGIK